MKRFLLTALVIFLWLFISVFLFNHIYSWLGIASFVAGIATILLYLESNLKNKEEK